MTSNLKRYSAAALFLTAFTLLWAVQKFEPGMISGPDVRDAAPDTLKVLALMVEFEDDDLDYTTGTGKFDSGYPDTLSIDSSPHDRSYFEDQLEYVRNYFESQSKGKVKVEYTVLSERDTLSHPVWYYNPNNGSDILLERLTELYSASWSSVKDRTDIDFKNFNTFVIFHAGSGQEFNPGFDETPFDIPSVYLSHADLEGSFVTAHDGTVISSTIILPECEWQIYDGGWYHAGMSGISCLMFAHRLGIPNLYSSGDGRSCIGRFGLMDQGSANFSGMVPAGVSAWVKELKGWADVEELTAPRDSIQLFSDSTIFKININSDEYFLIENRTPVNYTASQDTLYGYDRDGRTIRFFYDEDGIESYAAQTGFRTVVRLEDDDYDFGLPAGYDLDYGDRLSRYKGGILIWHIDRTRTASVNIENNSVNDDYLKRGVYLEEADGSFDIGRDYWLLDNGYGTELGWFYDAFFSDNEYWLTYTNSGKNRVEFGTGTYPRSDTNRGTATGILLRDFSVIGREMRFSYSFEEGSGNFTKDPGIGASSYLPCYTGGSLRHFFVSEEGEYRVYSGDSLLISVSSGASTAPAFRPVQAGDKVMTVSEDSMSVAVLDLISGDLTHISAPFKITGEPVDRILPGDDGVYILNEDMTFGLISGDFPFAANLSVLTGTSGSPVLVKGESGAALFSIDITETPYIVSTRELPADSCSHSFILSDEERSAGTSTIVLYSYAPDSEEMLLGVTDPDGDGKPELYSSENEVLMLKNSYGVFENGFPVSTGISAVRKGFVFNSGYIAASDSSSDFALVTREGEIIKRGTLSGAGKCSGIFGEGGYVYLYELTDAGTLNYRLLCEGVTGEYSDLTKGVIILKDPGADPGHSGVVSGSVYNWPNPVRGGITHFRFFLNEPAEVKIDIYDINGNRIETLKDSFTGSGEWFESDWNTSGVPSGIYKAVIDFGKEKKVVKAAVIK